MPLTPSTTDKFQKVGLPGSATNLAAPGYTIGNASVTVGSTTNHPTDTLYTFAIDRAQTINGVTSRIPGTYCEFEGIVSGGATIASMVLKYGTAQNYPAGSFTRVYIPVSSNRENALIDGLNQDHNGKGNHKNLTDDNGNPWLTRSQVAAAVNSIMAANAATGGAPSLAATGSDTNIDLQLIPKGSGVVKVDGAAPRQFFAQYNFIESGCVWSGTGYGTTLVGTMTAGVVWINGKRLTVAAIPTHTFTASKDTYVDFQDAGNGTANVIYTEVTNNTISPAIPNSLTEANNVRNAIVVSGASSIAAATSVNQGQETMVLPAVSSIAYAVTDGLGNLICPRDPNRKILGYRQITTQVNLTSTTASQIAGLSCPVIVPPGRKVKITVGSGAVFNSSTSTNTIFSIWDGVPNSGTQLESGQFNSAVSASITNAMSVVALTTPAIASKTYNAGLSSASGQASVSGSSTAPAFIMVELV